MFKEKLMSVILIVVSLSVAMVAIRLMGKPSTVSQLTEELAEQLIEKETGISIDLHLPIPEGAHAVNPMMVTNT